jgi:hypothetical protein
MKKTKLFAKIKFERSHQYMEIDNVELTISGRLIKTVKLTEERYKDVDDPIILLKKIKNSNIRADIFTFFQRLPESKPKYHY